MNHEVHNNAIGHCGSGQDYNLVSGYRRLHNQCRNSHENQLITMFDCSSCGRFPAERFVFIHHERKPCSFMLRKVCYRAQNARFRTIFIHALIHIRRTALTQSHMKEIPQTHMKALRQTQGTHDGQSSS